MVSEDIIVKNEFINDNRSIFAYYSEMYHRYVAYGLSAYLSLMVCNAIDVEIKEEYSKELQMPMVIIDQTKMDMLKYECVMMQDSIEASFYHLLCNQRVDERKYDEWAQWLRG